MSNTSQVGRFVVGERVRILPTPATPFSGLEGVIESVVPHPRGLTQLDGYVVKFTWGEAQKFFDAQLELARSRRSA